MPKTPDATELATSMVHLLQRFTGGQPDALKQIRAQVEAELAGARAAAARAEAQLTALDQLQALIDEAGSRPDPGDVTLVPVPPPPLKKAILRVLDEEPERRWSRGKLYDEIMRRGWGPRGANPRNTFTSRLRDLEKEQRLRRTGRDLFTSVKGGESD